MKKIKMIRSGGQSGVDRAALDTALRHGIQICGWCPKGGWAEDYLQPPGVRALYPELMETPRPAVEQRTVWNVRDSDATLIIDPIDLSDPVESMESIELIDPLKSFDLIDSTTEERSKGTKLTAKAAEILGKPYLIVYGRKIAQSRNGVAEVVDWLESLDDELDLNVAGPRESECAGAYQMTMEILDAVIEALAVE